MNTVMQSVMKELNGMSEQDLIEEKKGGSRLQPVILVQEQFTLGQSLGPDSLTVLDLAIGGEHENKVRA